MITIPMFSVFGSAQKKEKLNYPKDILPFWDPEHTASIWIDKIYVYDSGDREAHEPGEYFFKLFAIPQMWHWTTDIYEVGDETPTIPYNLGKIAAFKTKFTPQWIVILALEDDKDEGIANFNEFLDFTIIKFKPPKGDYPSNDPYMEIIEWENQYFKAVTKVFFSYSIS